MRTFILASLALLALPAFADSLDDFAGKPDYEIEALRLTRAKINTMLRHSALKIELRPVAKVPRDLMDKVLRDDEPLSPLAAKCVLKQIAELKKLPVDDLTRKAAFQINMTEIESPKKIPLGSGIFAHQSDGRVELNISTDIAADGYRSCDVNRAEGILSDVRHLLANAPAETEGKEAEKANEPSRTGYEDTKPAQIDYGPRNAEATLDLDTSPRKAELEY